MVKYYFEFDIWKKDASILGWVHAHDNTVVCDGENGELIGEFDGEKGWLISNEAKFIKGELISEN